MRIIAGTHRGRKIMAPRNLPVRPTTDMAKEGLFNILNHKLDYGQVKMLDLFCGTGNISYEAASRGVKNITAVDQDRFCTQFVKSKAQELNMPINVVKSEVMAYLEKASQSFNFIFIDPPYEFTFEQLAQIEETISARGILIEEGWLVIEHSSMTKLENLPGVAQQRKYGGTTFTFIHKKTADL